MKIVDDGKAIEQLIYDFVYRLASCKTTMTYKKQRSSTARHSGWMFPKLTAGGC